MSTPQQQPDSDDLFDELDALLQRMLALPVEGPGAQGEPEPEEGVEIVPLITVAEAAPIHYASGASEEPPSPSAPPTRARDEVFETIGREFSFSDPSGGCKPPVILDGTGGSRPSLGLEGPSGGCKPPESVPPLVIPPSEPASPATMEAIDLPEPATWLLPVVWVNNAYDRLTVPFGRPGRWFRTGAGRSLLGWAGVLMLVGAGGLVVWGCWLDWTW